MRTSAPGPNAVSIALSLALGREVESPSEADWRGAYAVARAERLFSLAWLRSGEQIRRYAPPDLVATWRTACVAASELADRQAAALRDIARESERGGEPPLVLKGLPLSERLYGERSARVSCDIDLFVPAAQRVHVHGVLTRIGWERWYDAAPYDASYRLTRDGASLFLEVHSQLVGEALAHCALMAERAAAWSADGATVRRLDGPVVPVYLAANIAKHGTPSLLSYLDLAAAWAALSPSDRVAANDIAARSRLGRCLQWARSGAEALSAAATGDAAALRALGFEGERRASVHAFLRLMWLADHPGDAVRILGAWAWPRSLRRTRDGIKTFWGRRLRRSFVGRFRYTREYTADAALRR